MINLLRRLEPHVSGLGCLSVCILLPVLRQPLKSEGQSRSKGARVLKNPFRVQSTEARQNPPTTTAITLPLSFGGHRSCLCQVSVVHKTRHLQCICLEQGDDRRWNRCWKTEQRKACAERGARRVWAVWCWWQRELTAAAEQGDPSGRRCAWPTRGAPLSPCLFRCAWGEHREQDHRSAPLGWVNALVSPGWIDS